MHLSRETLQSFIYLKLFVAGHMTLFVAGTRRPFWSVKPAWPLFPAIISTQLIATLIVAYGIILPSIGWKLALFVWGYALSWFIFNGLVKLGAYRIFEHRWFLSMKNISLRDVYVNIMVFIDRFLEKED